MAIKYGRDIDIFKILSIRENGHISNTAVLYYSYVGSIPNGKMITDEYSSKDLGWSLSRVKAARRELKRLGLVSVETISRGLQYIFVGSTDVTIDDLMEEVVLDMNKAGTTSKEEIEEIHNKAIKYMDDNPEEFEYNRIEDGR